jgi:hypothetical protein
MTAALDECMKLSFQIYPQFDRLCLSVVTVVDLDDATARFIDNDAVWTAVVLIEIAGDAYEQKKAQDETGARKLNDRAYVLGIAVDRRRPPQIGLKSRIDIRVIRSSVLSLQAGSSVFNAVRSRHPRLSQRSGFGEALGLEQAQGRAYVKYHQRWPGTAWRLRPRFLLSS